MDLCRTRTESTDVLSAVILFVFIIINAIRVLDSRLPTLGNDDIIIIKPVYHHCKTELRMLLFSITGIVDQIQ